MLTRPVHMILRKHYEINKPLTSSRSQLLARQGTKSELNRSKYQNDLAFEERNKNQVRRLDEILGTNIWTNQWDTETGQGQRVLRYPTLIQSRRPVLHNSVIHSTRRISQSVGSSEIRNFLLKLNIITSYYYAVGVKHFPRKAQSSRILSASREKRVSREQT